MNIFFLDRNPNVAAQYMCDKHVVKMIVETAQMLSTCHRMLDGVLERRPSVSGKRMVPYYKLSDWREDVLYKAVHFKHPCNVWIRESAWNYEWLHEHFGALLREYTVIYDKQHKCEQLYAPLSCIPNNISDAPRTKYPQAMADDCKHKDIVRAYRNYYKKYKSDFATWKNRRTPIWWPLDHFKPLPQ